MRLNVKDFGAKGDGVTDDGPAFRAAIDAFKNQTGPLGIPSDALGGVLDVPDPISFYRIVGNLDIARSIRVRGDCGYGRSATTRIQMCPDANGLATIRLAKSQPILEHLYLIHHPSTPAGTTLVHIGCPGSMEFCSVMRSRGVGVRVYGSETEATNANGWSLRNVLIENSLSHGFYVSGGDSNSGCALLVNSLSNEGIGFYASSFLNSTYLACQADSNKGGNYRAEGSVNRSVFVGCYSEGAILQKMDSPSLILGGAMPVVEPTDPATSRKALRIISDNVFGPFEVKNNGIRVSMGMREGEALRFQGDGDAYEWSLKKDKTDNKWHILRANSTLNSVLQLANDAAKLIIPKRFWIGSSANARSIEILPILPPIAGYVDGDRVLVRNPAAGTPTQYILQGGVWAIA